MRISDWSSDVCSSDLAATRAGAGKAARRHREGREVVLAIEHVKHGPARGWRIAFRPGDEDGIGLPAPADQVDDVAAFQGIRPKKRILLYGAVFRTRPDQPQPPPHRPPQPPHTYPQ